MTRRDRTRLLAAGVVVLLSFLAVALLGPSPDEDNPTPSIDSTGSHGARAAWEMLGTTGRKLERWDAPLAALPGRVDAQTTVVFADPDFAGVEEARPAVRALLARGARVLATGWTGGLLLAQDGTRFTPGGDCAAGTPSLTGGPAWKGSEPGLEAVVRCGERQAAVRFPAGAGEAVWWASSVPLQNASVTEDANLKLLLNSLGPGRRVLWDESLHSGPPSLAADVWSPPLLFAYGQLVLLGALLLLARGRRSGPLRADPVTPREAQGEFVRALGSLYRRAEAGAGAAATAYAALKRAAERDAGLPAGAGIEELAARLQGGPGAAAVLRRAEEAARGEPMRPRDALPLVLALYDYEQKINARTTEVSSAE